MANYIDADKLKHEILSNAVILNNPKHLSREDTLYLIDNNAIVDVVEVVRCIDCKHHYEVPDEKDFHLCMLRPLISQTTRDGFCNKGERKYDNT